MLLTTKFSDFAQNLKNFSPPQNGIAPMGTGAIQKARQQLVLAGEGWVSHSNDFLFVSRPYVLKEGQIFDPFESKEDLHPPVPNTWLIQHHLEYWNPNILQMDLKGDGFTVLENYLTHTDPTDSKVHAPPYIRLRLKKQMQMPFRIKFSGTPDDGETFAINAIDPPLGRTQFLKLGDAFLIHGISYVLKTYQHKIFIREDGLEVDISELTLENTLDAKKTVLILDKEINFPTSIALLKYLRDGSELKIKKGEIFTLPQQPDHKYKLMDVMENQAVLEEVATGEKRLISQLIQ